MNLKKSALFLLLIYGLFHAAAQPITPWENHIFPFCTDENPYGITYKSGTSGYADFPKSSDLGCLKSAPCPMWYYMQIDHPGDLLIYIEQYSTIGHIPLDVDFACWGPFKAESKRDFLNKLKNSYQLETKVLHSHRPGNGDHSHGLGDYPYHNLVDCSFCHDGTEWCYIPNAKSGEWYLLLITNFSTSPGHIHFERVDAQSTATTRCDVTLPITINPIPKGLRQIDEHTSAICMYQDKALVTIELETDDENALSEKSLKETRVDVFANGKTYQATLEEDHFECIIDIENDTTEYYAKVKCPDPDFELTTEKHRLVKTEDCDPSQLPFTEAPPLHPCDVDFTALKKGDKTIDVEFSEKDGYKDFNLEDYDVADVDYDNLLIENVEVRKDGNVLKLTPKLRGRWCECFMSDSITFRIKLLPVQGKSGVKPIEVPVTIGVNRHSAGVVRCFWVLVTIGGLLLLLLYLRLLFKKRRFKKNAAISPIYFDLMGNSIDNKSGLPLRKDGFPAWFARWFLPGTEKNTLTFGRPNITVTFMATESGFVVEVPEKSIDPKRMTIKNYNPGTEMPARLGSNATIDIQKADDIPEGYLRFDPGNEVDGGGYRILLGLLVVADVVALIALFFVLIKSIL